MSEEATDADAGESERERDPLFDSVERRRSDVYRLLSRRDHGAALRAALADPPLSGGGGKPGCGASEEVRAENASTVRLALSSVPDGGIDSAISELSPDERDVLMKYLYRLLSDRSGSGSGTLLRWHGRLLPAAGTGSIVRVMTDRRLV